MNIFYYSFSLRPSSSFPIVIPIRWTLEAPWNKRRRNSNSVKFKRNVFLTSSRKWNIYRKCIERTFANTSRPHEMLPNNAMITGFCETIIIIGRVRLNLIGNKYHLYWSIISLISSKASLNCWPTSQEIKSNANESKASIVKNINATP